MYPCLRFNGRFLLFYYVYILKASDVPVPDITRYFDYSERYLYAKLMVYRKKYCQCVVRIIAPCNIGQF